MSSNIPDELGNDEDDISQSRLPHPRKRTLVGDLEKQPKKKNRYYSPFNHTFCINMFVELHH